MTLDSSDTLQHRFAGPAHILITMLVIGLLFRLVLAWDVWPEIPHGPALVGALLVGVLADVAYAALFLIPAFVYFALLPQAMFRHPVHRFLTALVAAATIWWILVNHIAEWIFWDEFGVRFNFIAVDYLVYTTEVIENIFESYPVFAILGSIAIAALPLAYLYVRSSWHKEWTRGYTPLRSRLTALGAIAIAVALSIGLVSHDSFPKFENHYLTEISHNGPYSFFAAFRNNELDYHEFYVTEPQALVDNHIHDLLEEPVAEFNPASGYPEHRHIVNAGQEQRYNVIQIVIESFSAEFMGVFGDETGLTPNMDAIAADSLLFTNFLATGTRTVRGMESLTLSIPPTPGRSIVKRPINDVMFSTGTVFREKGYQPEFFYGGYGYFDNMNDFFARNGFEIHDRGVEDDEDTIFTNAWGVSDEDLYRWVIEDADRKHAAKQPFFDFVMTTSNHRPYTYPDNRIDIPSHTGRSGAVKYTDYAVGRFFEEARTKPWFDNTIFVIVGDHCAGSAGKTDLPVDKYHIPLMIYAPGIIQPGAVDVLSSQIDVAPTLFSLLNWSYDSEFFGRDILRFGPQDARAFISTYESLGLLQQRNGTLTVLGPQQSVEAFRVGNQPGEQFMTEPSDDGLVDAVTYYQRASELYYERAHRPRSSVSSAL